MDQQTLVSLVWLIPLLPLLAFFLIMLFTRGRDRLSHTIAIGAMIDLVRPGADRVLERDRQRRGTGRAPDRNVHPVAAARPEPLKMGVLVDPLTAVMLFMVPLACLMIFIYSMGYSNFHKPRDAHDEPGYPPHNGSEPLYSPLLRLPLAVRGRAC